MTPHFSDDELACKCGCGMLPQADFMAKVEKLRVKAGFPFPVTSGARCPKHNNAVSGTGLIGPHTTGRAIDIAVSRAQAHRLLVLACAAGFTGIGVNQKGNNRFIHLDDLETSARPAIWSY
jgi:uncharacterized protein YcbK (DUF882 family)